MIILSLMMAYLSLLKQTAPMIIGTLMPFASLSNLATAGTASNFSFLHTNMIFGKFIQQVVGGSGPLNSSMFPYSLVGIWPSGVS